MWHSTSDNVCPNRVIPAEAPADCGVLICNPPYGERLGDTKELGALYKTLGDIFKQRFQGWTAFILTGNKELAKGWDSEHLVAFLSITVL